MLLSRLLKALSIAAFTWIESGSDGLWKASLIKRHALRRTPRALCIHFSGRRILAGVAGLHRCPTAIARDGAPRP
jgi:hypothetical protein